MLSFLRPNQSALTKFKNHKCFFTNSTNNPNLGAQLPGKGRHTAERPKTDKSNCHDNTTEDNPGNTNVVAQNLFTNVTHSLVSTYKNQLSN